MNDKEKLQELIVDLKNQLQEAQESNFLGVTIKEIGEQKLVDYIRGV